jgi:hypothetical protein
MPLLPRVAMNLPVRLEKNRRRNKCLFVQQLTVEMWLLCLLVWRGSTPGFIEVPPEV